MTVARALVALLLGLFIALQALDAWSTARVLAQPGGRELNPVMRWLFDRLGLVGGFVAAKAAGIAVAAASAALLPPAWTIASLAIGVAGYAFVVIHNWRLVK